MAKVHFSARIEPRLKIQLEKEAERLRVSQTDIVMHAIKKSLKELKNFDSKTLEDYLKN